MGDCVDPRDGLDVVVKRNVFTTPEIEPGLSTN